MNGRNLAALVSILALAGCAYMPMGESQRIYSESPPAQRVQRSERPQASYKVQAGQVDPKTQPYAVMGKTYWPLQSGMGYNETGYASWYGMDFHGKKTATGETYDMFSVSAAHKTLPLGTKVRVTNLENGREVELVINDRGPFVDGRIIDLSYASARLLGMADNGLAKVRVVGLEDNPVLAQKGFKGVAVAQAATPPRQTPKFVEKNLDDEPVRVSAKSGPAKAPALAEREQGVRVVRREAAMGEPGGRYHVQVGAFAQDENARRVRDHLVQSGFRGASITRAVRGGRELSVVQVGGYDAREQAEEVLRALKDEFPSSFINSGA